MASITDGGSEQFKRLINSGVRQTRQALLLGACLADRERWIDTVRKVGEIGDWSYEFQLLVEMLRGDIKPTPTNVANSKRRLNLSDKSPKTILEQCGIWLRILSLETAKDELEWSIGKTIEPEILKKFDEQLRAIIEELDNLRESLDIVK